MKQLTILSNAAAADALAEQLTEQGALAVSMTDAEDQPVFQIEPNEQPLWDHVNVAALFTADTDIDQIITQLSLNTDTPVQCETLPDQDWVRLTQENFPPQCYGHDLWVCPNWHDTSDIEGTIVTIDPGLAFGTGTHATTALCLAWLAAHPPTDQLVIDYGCGSGILSLAALALGASGVVAIDHDEQALEATHNNATLNDFVSQDNLTIASPDQIPAVKTPYLIANILAKPLIQLADRLTKLVEPQGTLILSGLLTEEISRVYEAYADNFAIIDQTSQEEWARLVLQRST